MKFTAEQHQHAREEFLRVLKDLGIALCKGVLWTLAVVLAGVSIAFGIAELFK